MNAETENQVTIFLLEEDDETRRPLVQNLRGYGYHVIVALDAEDALERVSDGHVQANLVLVNLIGKSIEDALDIGRRIRVHAKYNGHTPLVVMPEKYDKDLEGTEVNVGESDWVFYLGEEPDQLQNLLTRLLNR
jgi:DNA-binding response OmpR family regulator